MTEHPNIASAMVAALAGLTVIEKGRTANVGTYKYDYADIGDTVKLTRPILAEHGLVALTPVHDHGTGLACTVVFLHTSGERLDFGPFPFPHGRDAQATGSMVTYHRRYALVAALGMAAGDDDDGAAAAPRQEHTRPAFANPKAGPLAARLAALPADAQEKILGWFGVDLEVWPTLADEHLDKLAGVIGKAEVKAREGNLMDSAPTDVVARLVARMEALPSDGDDLRASCRHGFESTFGNPEQLTVCDVPEAMALITTFEEAAAAGAPASGDELAARSARRAQHGPDEAA